MRIFVAIEPVDFRRGIDGLGAICRSVLGAEPMSGALFVFRSRGGSSIRVLSYDGQGYWICQKRLSRGKFRWWPSEGDENGKVSLFAHELVALLWNGDPRSTKVAPLWRPLSLAS